MDFSIDPTFIPTKKQEEFIFILEDDPIFNNVVPRIRTKIGLPIEGISLLINKDNKEITFTKPIKWKTDYKLLGEFVSLLLRLYDLPSSWFYTLSTIIIFNAIISPKRAKDGYKPIEFNYVGGIEKIIRRIEKKEKSRYVEIIVKEDISFDDLIKVLIENKKEIEILLSKIRLVPKIGRKNLTEYSVIYRLSQIMNDRKIGEELKKHRNKLNLPWNLDRKTINTYKKRYEKEIKKLPKNIYYLDQIESLLK